MSHNFKKKFGQNFLKDKNILKKIVSLTPLNKDDLVIEIGTGEGDLTEILSQNAKNVITYEIDEDLKDTLESKFVNSNVDIKFKDFLKTNLKEDINNYVYNNIYVIANIPYYITTSIIMKIIDEDINVKTMILLMQKEVGEKLVDSIILEFDRKEYIDINKEEFKNFIYDCFQYKRKTLKNNLKNYNLSEVERLLNLRNKSLNNRAEDLDINDFTFLYLNLFKQ